MRKPVLQRKREERILHTLWSLRKEKGSKEYFSAKEIITKINSQYTDEELTLKMFQDTIFNTKLKEKIIGTNNKKYTLYEDELIKMCVSRDDDISEAREEVMKKCVQQCKEHNTIKINAFSTQLKLSKK